MLSYIQKNFFRKAKDLEKMAYKIKKPRFKKNIYAAILNKPQSEEMLIIK